MFGDGAEKTLLDQITASARRDGSDRRVSGSHKSASGTGESSPRNEASPDRDRGVVSFRHRTAIFKTRGGGNRTFSGF